MICPVRQVCTHVCIHTLHYYTIVVYYCTDFASKSTVHSMIFFLKCLVIVRAVSKVLIL